MRIGMTMRTNFASATALLLGALLSHPAGLSAQYSDVTQDRFNESMDSGIEIEGTLHARVGLRSGPFVQLGVSDLRWTSFNYNRLNYTYEELRRFFGDRLPPREITKGHAKLEAQVSSVIACGYHFNFKKLINFQMARVEELEDGVFNGILNEYTHHVQDGELPDEAFRRRSAECIRRNKGHAIDLDLLYITDHYFPDREHGDRYENVIRRLLDERAERMEAEEAVTQSSEATLGTSSTSGGDKSKSGGQSSESVKEMEERFDREREAREARRERMSEEERLRDTQMSLSLMAHAQALKGDKLAAQGDYQGAIRAYQNAYNIYPDPAYQDKIQQMKVSVGTQAAATAAAGMLGMSVDNPRGINRFSGAFGVMLSPGATVQDEADAGVNTFSFDFLRLVPFDADHWWDGWSMDQYGLMGTLELQTDLWMTDYACGHLDGLDECAVGDLKDAWGVSLRPFVGLTYRGWFGAGLGLDGAYVSGRREPEPVPGVDRLDDEFEYGSVGPGHAIWQPAGTIWVGPQYRGEFVWKASMTATGALVENRMIEGPYLSEVIYRLNVRYNMLGATVGTRSLIYHSGVAEPDQAITFDGMFFGVLFGG